MIYRGKKRVNDDTQSITTSSNPMKKPKRAETRPCPVCDERIPLRLISTHAELETERVKEIMAQIGSTEVLGSGDHEEGMSTRNRRSAVRARKSLTALAPRSADTLDTDASTIRDLQAIARRRKQRHARLREMTKDGEDEPATPGVSGDEIVCPVCLQTVRGDADVQEAHIDACLAFETERLQEAQRLQQNRARESIDIEGDDGLIERVTDETSFRGTGFHIRDRNAQDVEGDVDIDGDDRQVFGDPQFTEHDILQSSHEPPNENTDDTRHARQSLRDLLIEGKSVPRPRLSEVKMKMEAEHADLTSAIISARKLGDPATLINALEAKITHLESTRSTPPTLSLCRICLDSYNEPTASTGCWHTCCRECWLRCLGSTKLCPICKRITAATELRRIYL